MQKKSLSMFFIMLFLSIPVGAMFKPGTMMRYVNSFKWLKSQNAKNFFQMNSANSYSRNLDISSYKNDFNSKVDRRWSLPFFGAGLFYATQSEDNAHLLMEKLAAQDVITDQEIEEALASNDGQQVVVDYFLSNSLNPIQKGQRLELVNKVLELNPKMSSQLVTFALENFKELVLGKKGRKFLISMVKNSDKVAQALGEYLIINYKDSFCDNHSGWYLLDDLLENEEFYKNIIEQACNNFSELIKEFRGRNLLECLVNYCVASKKDFLLEKLADATAKNFDISLEKILYIGGRDLSCLNSFRKNLLEYAEKNPEKFFIAYHGMFVINYKKLSDFDKERVLRLVKNNQDDFIKHNRHNNFKQIISMGSRGIEVALEITLSHLEQLTSYELDMLISQKNVSVNQRISDALTQPQAAQALGSLMSMAWESNGVGMVNSLLSLGQLNSELGEKIINLADVHFKEVVTSDCFYLLAELLKQNSQASIRFVERALNNLPLLLSCQNGQNFVKKLKELNNEFSQQLDKKINNISFDGFYEQLSVSQVYELNKVLPCSQALLKKINDALLSDKATFEDVFKKVIYLERCVEERELNPLTTTESHLLHNLQAILDSGIVYRYKQAPGLVKMDFKLHNKIRELENNGYITFVHGQRLDNLLVENWFTRLQKLKDKKSFFEFLYAHVKNLSADKQSEQGLRKKLLKDGRDTDYDRSRLLFLNGALFGNTTNLGSSTRHWTIDNDNVGPRYVDLKDAFKDSLCERFYQKYERELKELEKEFSIISDYGNTLLIAVPKDQLSKCVFSAKPGGYKKLIYIKGVGETSDINLIMDTLKHEPHKMKNSDEVEFCLIMTQDKDGGLNPKSGIKVYSYIAPKDENKYEEFKKKENNLWQKIANEIDDSANDEYYLNLYGGDA